MSRRTAFAVGSFLAWTVFVWGVVRVRNILGDDTISDTSRTWLLLLAASLWLPAIVLLVVLGRSLLTHRELPAPARVGVAVLGVWTTSVWLVRGADIALTSDEGAAFVAVHLVLAVVSVGLAVLAARSLRSADPGSLRGDGVRTLSR